MTVDEAIGAFVVQAGPSPTHVGDGVGQRGELGIGVGAPVAWVFGQFGWTAPFQAQRRQCPGRGSALRHGGGSLFSAPVSRQPAKRPETLWKNAFQAFRFTKGSGQKRTDEKENCPEN